MKKYSIYDKFFVCILYLLLILNYMYNIFNPNNTVFKDFQSNSDSLALNMITAKQAHVKNSKWGLGLYADSAGWLIGDPIALRKNKEDLYLSNEYYVNGYAKTGDKIVVSYNAGTAYSFTAGNWIRFEDGTEVQINSVEFDIGEGASWTITANLDIKEGVCEAVNGNLLNAVVLDENGNEYPRGFMDFYDSQYGLQGRIIGKLAFIGHNEIVFFCLHLLCAALTAVALMCIVQQIYIKYDSLMAIIFYVVFLLSPWIINFARNTYWLEFLWFIPMLIGLVYLNYGEKARWIRCSCYVLAFFAILIKALCGYEYITTIMLGMISFLMVDVFEKILLGVQKKEICKDFLKIFLLGVSALAGFICAFMLHAGLRGDGNVWEGIKIIIKEDALRSTLYSWTAEYGESYRNSMSASLWQVLILYFYRPEEIISGIGGNYFPLLVVGPIVIFLYNGIKNKVVWRDCLLYGMTFITSVSWFILGKSHSAMHGFLNFVLWYFGYIQICFYVILKQLVQWLKGMGADRFE